MSLASKKFGVYNIIGIKYESSAKIKPVGLIDLNDEEFVGDKFIEKINIDDKVFGEIYVCNIIGQNLMASKKQPMMYISVVIDMPIQRVHLYRLYFCFTITEKVVSSDQFLKSNLSGDFNLEIVIDGKHTELGGPMGKFKGNTKTIEMMKDFIKSTQMLNLTKSLVQKENDRRREKYNMDYGSYNIPKPTIKLDEYESKNVYD